MMSMSMYASSADYWKARAENAELAIAEAIAAEREACAKECERMVLYPGGRQESAAHDNVWAAAKAIRKRSNAAKLAEVKPDEWCEWSDVPTVVIPKTPYVYDFARCTKKLQAQGVAYPRTCAECGLGPCRA